MQGVNAMHMYMPHGDYNTSYTLTISLSFLYANPTYPSSGCKLCMCDED